MNINACLCVCGTTRVPTFSYVSYFLLFHCVESSYFLFLVLTYLNRRSIFCHSLRAAAANLSSPVRQRLSNKITFPAVTELVSCAYSAWRRSIQTQVQAFTLSRSNSEKLKKNLKTFDIIFNMGS